ncbi:MAG: hypothetical protein K8Q89_01635 [Nitrosarchaeum sp.]|nr:hypothetical protein [Nitrosarchaeum sp.]
MKLSILIMVVIIIVVIGGHYAFAHEPNFEVKTTKDILKFCTFFYDEYRLLGPDDLAMQHPQYPNLRACGILYNNIAWNSTHPQRDTVLIAEIEKYLGDAAYIKERHIKNSEKIPIWLKDDAKMWANEEATDTLFVNGIRKMLEDHVLNPSLKNTNRNCIEDKLCLMKSDFMKYSYSNKYGQYITQEFIVDTINKEGVLLNTQKNSKEDKEVSSISIDNQGTVQTEKCCIIEKFMFLTPINLGYMIMDNLKIVSDATYEFDGKTHQVWIAQNSEKQDMLIIDKQTGLVLSDSHKETGLTIKWEKVELMETNIFEKKYANDEFVIPKWFKTTTKWFLNNLISESEYIKATENLLERQIIRI